MSELDKKNNEHLESELDIETIGNETIGNDKASSDEEKVSSNEEKSGNEGVKASNEEEKSDKEVKANSNEEKSGKKEEVKASNEEEKAGKEEVKASSEEEKSDKEVKASSNEEKSRKEDKASSDKEKAGKENNDSLNYCGLPKEIIKAVIGLGYEKFTPVQEQSIPYLLEGHDLLAQAQTGTGKTAAFALPGLAMIDAGCREPQIIVLAPTRELAIQVAEAYQSYGKHVKGFHVMPIYGGQDYRIQLKALDRGPQVVVGTPGRVMDHLRRGTLKFEALKMVVLDEADEMLKMGFIDDIQWILEQIPHQHQTALFSATMPGPIKKITQKYLKNPKEVIIKNKKNAVSAIDQCFIGVRQHQKLELLTHILEAEDIKSVLIFSRTKNQSTEISEKLQARGYAAAALNGDMNQSMREKVLGRLKNGSLDIVIATDVAARGIDVDSITHVVNYDIPFDAEAYTHRIGRTGRAGRKGKAISFITPREHRLLNDIERSIGTTIRQIEPPSIDEMREKRGQQLSGEVIGLIEKGKKLTNYNKIIEDIMTKNDVTVEDVAAALAFLLQKSNPLPRNEIETADAEKGRSFSGGGRQRNGRSGYSGGGGGGGGYRSGGGGGGGGGYRSGGGGGGDRNRDGNRGGNRDGDDRRGSSEGYRGGNRSSDDRRGSGGGNRSSEDRRGSGGGNRSSDDRRGSSEGYRGGNRNSDDRRGSGGGNRSSDDRRGSSEGYRGGNRNSDDRRGSGGGNRSSDDRRGSGGGNRSSDDRRGSGGGNRSSDDRRGSGGGNRNSDDRNGGSPYDKPYSNNGSRGGANKGRPGDSSRSGKPVREKLSRSNTSSGPNKSKDKRSKVW